VRRSDKSLAWTSALSFGAHGLFALLIALAPRPPAFVAPLSSNEIRLIEVADLTIPEEMEAEVTEIVEAVESDPTLRPAGMVRDPRPRAPSIAGATPSPATPATEGLTGSIVTAPAIELPMVPGETEEARERRLRAMGGRIAASRAAADFVLRDDPGPVMPSGPAGLDDPGGETVRPMTVAEAEALHDGHLGAAAATKTHLSDTHPPLTPHPDGSYTYRGHAFTATIRPTGEVVYSDRGAVEYDVGSGTGSFDLGDMVMGAAGQDPYAQERAWFEEEHQELIDRLVDEARVADRTRSLRRLRSDLALIWADRTRSAERRRRQLFERWDQASEDEGDREARDIIMAYIRENVPRDGEDAYTDAEIASLNAGRESTERFAPY
jgi:hypothetical protein